MYPIVKKEQLADKIFLWMSKPKEWQRPVCRDSL